jgi:hypothetical protein
MLAIRRFRGCPRCGGDLFEEPGTTRLESRVRYVSCLQCGELRCFELPSPPINRDELRGRPGRPRKHVAV